MNVENRAVESIFHVKFSKEEKGRRIEGDEGIVISLLSGESEVL